VDDKYWCLAANPPDEDQKTVALLLFLSPATDCSGVLLLLLLPVLQVL